MWKPPRIWGVLHRTVCCQRDLPNNCLQRAKTAALRKAVRGFDFAVDGIGGAAYNEKAAAQSFALRRRRKGLISNMQESYLRRTWAEIDLNALEHNFCEIRRQTELSADIAAVVKADAYGHGAKIIAPELQRLGVGWFAVSNLEEAQELRRAGVVLPVLILGYTPPEYAAELAKDKITQALLSADYAASLSREAERAGVTVSAHLKIDTGMSRVGFFFQSPERDYGTIEKAAEACRLPGLDVNGIFMHFAVADAGEDGRVFTNAQYQAFQTVILSLKEKGISFRWRHCDNSGAILCYQQMNLDLVRPGIILYGLLPDDGLAGILSLRPVMALRSVVALIKTIPAGSTVSYGRTYTAERPVTVATIPVGYADGYSRSLSSKGSVLIHGRRAPIIGRICMDQMMVDVTDIPNVKEGDTVTLVGRDGKDIITFEELARLVGTINYELVCSVSRRVPRVYLRDGAVASIEDYLRSEIVNLK